MAEDGRQKLLSRLHELVRPPASHFVAGHLHGSVLRSGGLCFLTLLVSAFGHL